MVLVGTPLQLIVVGSAATARPRDILAMLIAMNTNLNAFIKISFPGYHVIYSFLLLRIPNWRHQDWHVNVFDIFRPYHVAHASAATLSIKHNLQESLRIVWLHVENHRFAARL